MTKLMTEKLYNSCIWIEIFDNKVLNDRYNLYINIKFKQIL